MFKSSSIVAYSSTVILRKYVQKDKFVAKTLWDGE